MSQLASVRRMGVLGGIMVVFLAFCFVAAATTVTLRMHAHSSLQGVVDARSKVVCEVSALKILKVEQRQMGSPVLLVTLQNDSPNDITAVAACIGTTRSFYRDYLTAEVERAQQLPPGGIDEFIYPADEIPAGGALAITAVVFRDLSSTGNSKDVAEILDKRLGMKIQFNRYLPYLDDLRNVDQLFQKNPAAARSEIRRQRQFVESLPIARDDGGPISPALERGLKQGLTYIQKYLSDVESLVNDEASPIQKGVPSSQEISQPSTSERSNAIRRKLARIDKDFRGLATRL